MFSSSNIERALTIQDILREVSQVDIFRFYLGVIPVFNQLICSPLRADKTPTCGFIYRNNRVYLKDFATGEHLDCFNVVGKIYSLKYLNQVLNKIWQDVPKIKENKMLNPLDELALDNIIKEYFRREKVKTRINIETRDYRDYDLEWWNKFGIKESTLRKFNVFPVARAFVNGALKYVEDTRDPCYAYYFKSTDSIKLYRPFNKKYKWMSNVPHSELQGDQLFTPHKDLIITKSLKDVMSLYEAGYNAVAVQSETSLFPDQLVEMCAKVSANGKRVFVFYDNDEPGVKAAVQKSQQYKIPMLFIPIESGCKDSSDFAFKYGLTLLKETIDAQIESSI